MHRGRARRLGRFQISEFGFNEPASRRRAGVASSLNRTSAIRLASEGGEAKAGAFAYAPRESSGRNQGPRTVVEIIVPGGQDEESFAIGAFG
jgi:hypothetical protein